MERLNMQPKNKKHFIASFFIAIVVISIISMLSGCDNNSVSTNGTTNQDIIWQSYKDRNMGFLNDVAIINENDIWAVGLISVNDTVNHIDSVFNVLHWDGKKWNYIGIENSFNADGITNKIYSLVAFSKDDIWFSNYMHWNGKNFVSIATPDNYIYTTSMWGTSGSDLYLCGDYGFLEHYNGVGWQKLNNNSDYFFSNITGAYNEKTGKNEILLLTTTGLYKLENNNLTEINTDSVIKVNNNGNITYNPPSTIWFVPDQHYYLAGRGIFEKNKLTDSLWGNKWSDITRKLVFDIKGNNLNDVYAACLEGQVLHYNGLTWESYWQETSLIQGAYYKIALKDNLIVMVGEDSNYPVVLTGRRIR